MSFSSYFRRNSVSSGAWDGLIYRWVFFNVYFSIGFSSNTETESTPMWCPLIEITFWVICCWCWSLAYKNIELLYIIILFGMKEDLFPYPSEGALLAKVPGRL
jgi:hypothetical protein